MSHKTSKLLRLPATGRDCSCSRLMPATALRSAAGPARYDSIICDSDAMMYLQMKFTAENAESAEKKADRKPYSRSAHSMPKGGYLSSFSALSAFSAVKIPGESAGFAF